MHINESLLSHQTIQFTRNADKITCLIDLNKVNRRDNLMPKIGDFSVDENIASKEFKETHLLTRIKESQLPSRIKEIFQAYGGDSECYDFNQVFLQQQRIIIIDYGIEVENILDKKSQTKTHMPPELTNQYYYKGLSDSWLFGALVLRLFLSAQEYKELKRILKSMDQEQINNYIQQTLASINVPLQLIKLFIGLFQIDLSKRTPWHQITSFYNNSNLYHLSMITYQKSQKTEFTTTESSQQAFKTKSNLVGFSILKERSRKSNHYFQKNNIDNHQESIVRILNNSGCGIKNKSIEKPQQITSYEYAIHRVQDNLKRRNNSQERSSNSIDKSMIIQNQLNESYYVHQQRTLSQKDPKLSITQSDNKQVETVVISPQFSRRAQSNHTTLPQPEQKQVEIRKPHQDRPKSSQTLSIPDKRLDGYQLMNNIQLPSQRATNNILRKVKQQQQQAAEQDLETILLKDQFEVLFEEYEKKYIDNLNKVNIIGKMVAKCIELLNAHTNVWIMPIFLIFKVLLRINYFFKRLYQLRMEVYEDLVGGKNPFQLSNFSEFLKSQIYINLKQTIYDQNQLIQKELSEILISASEKTDKLEANAKDKMLQLLNMDLQSNIKDLAFVYLYSQIYGRVKQLIAKNSTKQLVDIQIKVQCSLIILERAPYDLEIINIEYINQQKNQDAQNLVRQNEQQIQQLKGRLNKAGYQI